VKRANPTATHVPTTPTTSNELMVISGHQDWHLFSSLVVVILCVERRWVKVNETEQTW
jgi:hypothetical protein